MRRRLFNPLAALSLLLCALPLWRGFGYRGRRAARRLQAGLCARCGYDLRASTDRCPECGTPIMVKGRAA